MERVPSELLRRVNGPYDPDIDSVIRWVIEILLREMNNEKLSSFSKGSVSKEATERCKFIKDNDELVDLFVLQDNPQQDDAWFISFSKEVKEFLKSID